MRRVIASLILFALLSAAIGFAIGPAAAEDATIQPGVKFTREVPASADSTISYSWTSSVALSFELRDQADNILNSSSGTTFGFGLYTVDKGGMYTLEWTNLNVNAAEITVDIDVIDIGTGLLDDIADALVLALLIVLAVIVIIIIVVVLVVVKGGKKQAPHAAGPGGGVVPPMGNNCAVCGTSVDPSMAFCAKCGAKLR